MTRKEKFIEGLKHPSYMMVLFLNRLAPFIKNDELFLKLKFFFLFKRKLDLKNPQTLNEKLQWLKLYNRKPEQISMVDKIEAKKYVANIIGEEYIIPTIGQWDKFEDIDFNKLPNQFVLKCTHDSGGVVVCKDKSTLNKAYARKVINFGLGKNHYWGSREWPYKMIKPRIIAEELISDWPDKEGLSDYKFFCFDGYVQSVMLCLDRHLGDTKFYFFDKDWNLLRLNKRGLAAPEGFTLPKPKNIDKMFEIASLLSKGHPFIRVDLYNSGGKIYFGELTLYPDSGFDPNLLPGTDKTLGKLISLPI